MAATSPLRRSGRPGLAGQGRGAGIYANRYFGPAEIAVQDGGLRLVIGPARITYSLTHWDGDTFVLHPSSENQTDGSVSLLRFGDVKAGVFRTVAIEHLEETGFGTFRRQ